MERLSFVGMVISATVGRALLLGTKLAREEGKR